MHLIRTVKTKLPTPWGNFWMIGFKEKNTGRDHLALIFGKIKKESSFPILVRIHSECLTGDALFSLRCDCGFQLQSALNYIAKEGCGILLYQRQEGRNIGLFNKIKAYALQDKGADTVEANHILGFAADERDFSLCADMLKLLGINRIRLLTNNPEKVNILKLAGIHISERIPLIVGYNSNNIYYLYTKKYKMGHILR